MPKDALEVKLAALKDVRGAEPAVRTAALRRALRDRSNVIVAKAADLAAEGSEAALIPDLLATYDTYFGDDMVQRDPLVRGKEAIVRALRALGHRDPVPFVRGLHHVQLEPAWVEGGKEDRAGGLRCACAHALVDADLPAVDALRELVPHFVDPLAIVRLDAIRAVAQFGTTEGALLVRLKAYAGDEEAEVLGECFLAVFEREPASALAFIEPFLTHKHAAVRAEAAASLAVARDPAALTRLRTFVVEDASDDARAVAVSACAGSPRPEVVDLLVDVARGRNANLATRAVRAAAESRFRDGARERLRTVVADAWAEEVRAAFAEAF